MANDRIPEILGRYVDEIRAEVHRQAMEALSSGFVGDPRAPGKLVKVPRASSGRKGGKRDPKLLEQLQVKLQSFVAKNPGLRIEEINKQMGTSTKDLALPIKKLIALKALTTKGQKRSTKYFAGGARAKKSSK